MEGIRDGGEEGGKGVDCCGVFAFSTSCTGADSDAHCSDSVHNSPCTIFSLSSEGAGDGGLVAVAPVLYQSVIQVWTPVALLVVVLAD